MSTTQQKDTPHSLGENIWAVRTDLSMGPINIQTQMTIIRLPDQSLLLISPVTINTDLKASIEALGKVSHIISPNNFHHLHVNSAKTAFPNAQYLCSDALIKRIKGLPEHQDLHQAATSLWQDQLETLRLSSSHMGDEVIFYHKESKTLIVTDVFQYLTGDFNFATKLFARITGTNNKVAISRLFKTMIKNKQEFQENFSRMQKWDYETVLIPHNTNLYNDAKAQLEAAINKL